MLGLLQALRPLGLRDPELARADPRRLRVGPGALRRPDFPAGREYRKYWEVAMTLRALRALGGSAATTPGARGGGRATRRRFYWLTRHVGKVVATDLYETEDAWSKSDSGSDDAHRPGPLLGRPWNPERLEVRHMSGLDLHSRTSPSTRSSPPARSSTSATSPTSGGASRRCSGCCGPAAWPRWRPSSGSRAPGIGDARAAALRRARASLPAARRALVGSRHPPRHLRSRRRRSPRRSRSRRRWPTSEAGRRGWSRYPHIVLRDGDYLWTSVHVALIKSRLTAAEWRRRAPKLPPKQTRAAEADSAGAAGLTAGSAPLCG